ncbi:MAG: histidine triad nucleotide-binding protein [Planctomycetes bacterium]|nr:histidine triad nucleotide-binding protein [Planctomycetota bacterium]
MNYDPSNIFAKVLRGEIPVTTVYENDFVLGFRDIAPQAPAHILLIPKAPLPCLADASNPDHAAVLGQLMLAVGEVARQQGFAEDGFRVVINNGARANQTVFHLHVHILAGRDFDWPPG